ncbi:hypothetical protein HDU99_003269, partial [Rhizoclosmatium hyalinum]
VAHILADENDAILVPAPVYGAFRSDLLANAGVTAVFVNAKDSLPSVDQLDRALLESPKPVKALLITNPGNPTGKVVPLSLLKEWIEWAHARNLHCIVDEVYMFSVWDPSADFVSVLTMDVDPLRTHIIWSFSKDFCLNGIRAGALISKNQQVLDAYNELAYFHGIPVPVDRALADFLADTESIDRFTKTNYERLRDSFAYATTFLKSHNIPFTQPDSAFFLWVDLSKYISHPKVVSESAAKNLSGSLILFHKFLDGGLYIAPSEAFFCDPAGPDASRFRINVPVPRDVLELGLDRMMKVLDQIID